MLDGSKDIVLRKFQFISIITGAIVGISILILPNDLAQGAHQDGWIAAILGVFYPLYEVLLSKYLTKRFPDNNILFLSKKCFGKFLGTILNIIFATFFAYISIIVTNAYKNLMIAYVVGWLTPFKLIAVVTIIIAYAASKGLNILAKISEIAFIITFILTFSSIPALKLTSLLNIKPIFGSGIKAILITSMSSLLSYSGIELIFLFNIYVKDKSKISWYSFIGAFSAMIVYTWICFISILYLGPDITVKSQWPFLLAVQSVTITIINNYGYLFMLMWSIVAIKCSTIHYYVCAYILKDCIKNIKFKNLCFLMYPIFVYLSFILGNEINRKLISGKLIKIYTAFNLLYITIITIIIFLKKDEGK